LDETVTIRPAEADDHDFLLTTAKRLSAAGVPPWRTGAEVVTGEQRTLRAFFVAPPVTCAVFVAHGKHGRSGFVYLEQSRDYFTLETHGHVGMLAVTEEAEGQGAAAALMRAAEAWARDRGYRKLTLSVFEHNRRARNLYEHLGFAIDTIKYLKTI
jgi:ribosomal protein S18 acetylase RimI-like enzyme